MRKLLTATMWPFSKTAKKRDPLRSLRQALEELAGIGVALAPGATVADLLELVGGDLESAVNPVVLLSALGDESDSAEEGLMSHDVWHLDAECIEDHGDYARLAKRFDVLARGRLGVSDIKDYVDIEAGKAWVEFMIKGKPVHWDLAVHDDWMDEKLYLNFQYLLGGKADERFMIAELGQDSLVLFGNTRKRDAISGFSGLDFR